ncbi:MAG: rod shape-determining protein MreD [Bacteroidetes bacterium]|nr:rod shape-determining protein MreD [Bacteroidota bacterium]
MYFSEYLKFAIIFAVLIIVQVSFVWLIAISNYNITPDLVIVLVIYLGFTRGQIAGMVSGFITGLTLDLLSGSFIGLSALSYCVAGFIAGYFSFQDTAKSSVKRSMIGIMFLCTVIAYSIFFWIYYQGSSVSFPEIFMKYVLTTTLYTLVIGTVLVIFSNVLDTKK